MVEWFFLGLAAFFWVSLWWEIFRKAGCSGFLGILMVIPVINFVMLIAIIMMDWPIEREVSRLRLRLGEATEKDAARVLTEATKLDQRGDWSEAIALYQLIAEKMTESEYCNVALRLMESVREKQTQTGVA